MSAGSIVSRVTRGTILASLITAVTLASAAAAIAFKIWRAREERALQQSAAALAQAVEREALDESWTLEQAAPEALRESGITGYRIEIWAGERLVAANRPGDALGPYRPGRPPSGWIVAEQRLAGALQVLVAARTREAEALRVFGWSLLLATPLCLGVALAIGRVVGRRATRPLVEFKARIATARPFAPLPAAGIPGAPSEVRELEDAFRALWQGLGEALARELEFAANASHELRTPLTRIRLHAERAAADAGPVARRELSELAVEVDRMVRLVESLLVLARDVSAGIPRAEVVNLADVARSVAARVLGAGRVDLAGLPDEALVRGDEELLDVAVENLLDNARKFSSPERPVQVSLSEQDGQVRLAVASPGARIAEAERDRLFERFYRAREARASRGGHGLGLPLARHIARLHGGDVACVSEASQDATFELALPSWWAAPRSE